jgi:hypothetical protein
MSTGKNLVLIIIVEGHAFLDSGDTRARRLLLAIF